MKKTGFRIPPRFYLLLSLVMDKEVVKREHRNPAFERKLLSGRRGIDVRIREHKFPGPILLERNGIPDHAACILYSFILYFCMHKKIKTVRELIPIIGILRGTGKKIVFTNGCFDLIHTGHTRYLSKARSLGDVLIVAVNSDTSVRALKGDKRPVNRESDRMETLAALESVDYVTIFDELDPHRIIAELQPDVLVKGGDWPIERIIGRDIVEARGGRVISAGYIEGQSTTEIIERIAEKYGKSEVRKVRRTEGKTVGRKEGKKTAKPKKAKKKKKAKAKR